MGFFSTFADKVLGFDPAPAPVPLPAPEITQAVSTTVTVEPARLEQIIAIESPIDQIAQGQVLAALGQATDISLSALGRATGIAQVESLRDLVRSQGELTLERERRQRQELIFLGLALGALFLFTVRKGKR